MALFRHLPMSQIVNQLDVILPGDKPFVAPSAIVQARQRLGELPIKEVFEQTQLLWNQHLPHSNWCGLKVLGVDGVVWRVPDSPENSVAFDRTLNERYESEYPQVRMVCLMELNSHLIMGAFFDSVGVNEMKIAETLLEKTPDYSLTLFDKGFFSLGLLHQWQESGQERHWMLPLKKTTKYQIIHTYSKNHHLVELTSCPQARKKWPTLPEKLRARLVTKVSKGKTFSILTSMLDPKRYPADELIDLYTHRWEIELGYREMKQYMLQSRLTLRSKKPEMVRQELWGILLAYNLLRFQMARMAYSLQSIEPNQISFNQAAAYIIKELTLLPAVSPGNIPQTINRITSMARAFVLPDRRSRVFPREVKKRPNKYPTKVMKLKCQSVLN